MLIWLAYKDGICYVYIETYDGVLPKKSHAIFVLFIIIIIFLVAFNQRCVN